MASTSVKKVSSDGLWGANLLESLLRPSARYYLDRSTDKCDWFILREM